MIQKYVDAWFRNKHKVEENLSKSHPGDYPHLVSMVISALDDDGYEKFEPQLDWSKIHTFGGENYQGDYLFIIQEKHPGYGSSESWCSIIVSYGSCSGCDTLQAIEADGEYGKPPNAEQVKQYMQLCLNIVQGLKRIE